MGKGLPHGEGVGAEPPAVPFVVSAGGRFRGRRPGGHVFAGGAAGLDAQRRRRLAGHGFHVRGGRADARRLRKPSFVCFMSMGNELQPDFGVLNAMRSHFQRLDPRRLYTSSSFTFEKGHGVWPEPGDDFYVTQWTKKGWVRGQGVFNSESPRFDRDFSQAVSGMQVPLITHEIGQYAVYPNLAEIPKYTGVLEPLNFKAVENDLKAKGLLRRLRPIPRRAAGWRRSFTRRRSSGRSRRRASAVFSCSTCMISPGRERRLSVCSIRSGMIKDMLRARNTVCSVIAPFRWSASRRWSG